MKRVLSLAMLFISLCVSCGGNAGGVTSQSEDTTSENPFDSYDPSYDYELVDDAKYGKAIYPNVALRLLREIEAHNKENGIDFLAGEYSSYFQQMVVDGFSQGEYAIEEENYIPGKYYYFEKNDYFLVQSAKAFYYDDYESPNEFYRGEYSNVSGDHYYTSSSLGELSEYMNSDSHVESHHEAFLSLTERIAREQLTYVVSPKEIKCYSSGEGSLYINIYRTHSDFYNNPKRLVYRIVYESYLPVFVTCQSIDGIVGDDEYYNDSKVVSFKYSSVEMENLNARFTERKDPK